MKAYLHGLNKTFEYFLMKIILGAISPNQSTLGAIFSNQNTLGAIFASIFKEFSQIFRDFTKVFTDFAQIFTKSKLFGVHLYPHLLHHCLLVSFFFYFKRLSCF